MNKKICASVIFMAMVPIGVFAQEKDTYSALPKESVVQVIPESQDGELLLEVKAKKRLIEKTSAASKVEISKEAIQKLPQGDQIKLSKLLAITTPGIVEGAFGVLFVRGNHGNIQYQIDGVQLPESPSNTFAEPFSPRNIDHMEVITGGVPAEFGEKLAAVVVITSKSGPETPGGTAELNYGSFNRFSPQVTYGGSNESGDFHYFISGNYFRTDRGLDTPQPVSPTDQSQGGKEYIHDQASGTNQFVKLDWQAGNQDKFTLTASNNYSQFQIPNYPSTFQPTSPFFTNGGFNYTPPSTDNNQAEYNDFLQVVWKHTVSPRSFFQLAPYWKYSYLKYNNDLANDLNLANPNRATASSFYQNRHINNIGIKADFSSRINDENKIKAGVQLQAGQSVGSVAIQTAGTSFTNSDTNTGYSENIYVLDEYTISKAFNLNAGLRFTATQFDFSGLTPKDSLLQPRVGLNYLPADTTKLHVFYGKLFMPAPVENLRVAFNNLEGTALTPYDIKGEKDDYFEFGVDQQFLQTQLATMNVYYKTVTNMLDDAQLLSTSLAQPYNYAEGFAYGLELSVKGQINEDWSEYANYSYQIAKGRGLSGGLFAFPPNGGPSSDYQFLDHVQMHTFNSGLTYSKNKFWGTLQLLYGSGLRTGEGNAGELPAHITMDSTFGYEFHGDSWLSQFKLSLDVLNIFDNAYPITIANGFTGSRYAPGREIFIHLVKSL
ncbi:MAG: TonB-dependent receptor [Bdellovibrionia bacterium]